MAGCDWWFSACVKGLSAQVECTRALDSDQGKTLRLVLHREQAMPRYTVHIRDEWLTVPCRDPSYTIQWLGIEALKRYTKNKPDNGGITSVKDVNYTARRCQGQGLLDADDTIEDVLEDNDFIELGNKLNPFFL